MKRCDQPVLSPTTQDLNTVVTSPLVKAADLVQSDARFKDALQVMGAQGHDLDEMIRQVRGTRLGNGLGALAVESFLDLPEDAAGGGARIQPGSSVVTEGRILAYRYDHPSGKPDCLAVEITTEFTPGQSGQKRIRKYVYHVFGDFAVAPYDPTDPTNVFPGADTVAIPIATANRQGRPPYRYKLWARGNMLEVTRVEKQKPGGTLEPVQPNSAEGRKLYAAGPDDCLDMMFAMPPPAELGTTPPAYCLGRCANPPLLNTGV